MLFPSLGHTSQPGDMYLRFLEGDVQVKTEDTAEWLPASINMPLIDGDQIWVPENARAELMLRDGTIVRLDRNSYLEILTSEEKLAHFISPVDESIARQGSEKAIQLFLKPRQLLFVPTVSPFSALIYLKMKTPLYLFSGVKYTPTAAQGRRRSIPATKWSFLNIQSIHGLTGLALWTNGNNGTDEETRN